MGSKVLNSEQKKDIHRSLQEGIREGGACGFQLSLGWREQTLGSFCVGRDRPYAPSSLIQSKTWFDWASITKIVATASLWIKSLEANRIPSLSRPLKEYLPSLQSGLKERTPLELLEHRAGLGAVFHDTKEVGGSRQSRIEHFLKTVDQSYESSEAEIYSDVGYLLLGILLEKLWNCRLKHLFGSQFQWLSEVSYSPVQNDLLGLRRLFHLKHPARNCNLESGGLIEGEVQDPRARWLEGDAGHAGLFGTARALERWGAEIYRAYHGTSPFWDSKVLRKVLDLKTRSRRFVAGFDTPDEQSSQAGSEFSEATIGHLGYTGCSFWMELDRGARVSLLSHIRYPELSSEAFQKWRPQFHDWLHKEIFSRLSE